MYAYYAHTWTHLAPLQDLPLYPLPNKTMKSVSFAVLLFLFRLINLQHWQLDKISALMKGPEKLEVHEVVIGF